MIWSVIFLALGVVALIIGSRLAKGETYSEADSRYIKNIGRTVGGALLLVGVVIGVFSSFYTQDAGEAKVQRSFTGQLVGKTTEPGLHFKAPWVDTITFDIRNQVVSYVGPADPNGKQSDHSGGTATGAQITFQDKEGVTGNLDVVVRYSLHPDAVIDIYQNYQTQEAFVSRVVTNSVRSIARNIPARYNTIQVFQNRSQIGQELRAALEDAWADEGIVVEEVSLQEIRYSPEVTARFDEAQAARIAESRAQAEQEVARVAAETRVIEAEGKAEAQIAEARGAAEANRILTQSLTPEVLTQRYLDAIANGTTFVVPEGSTPLVTVDKGAK